LNPNSGGQTFDGDGAVAADGDIPETAPDGQTLPCVFHGP
jgi:hypothetical protein